MEPGREVRKQKKINSMKLKGVKVIKIRGNVRVPENFLKKYLKIFRYLALKSQFRKTIGSETWEKKQFGAVY